MQIAMVGAGFSPDEADQLRRSMAAWRRRGGVEHFRERLIQGLVANGCDEDFAEGIFRQLEGFGEYGFPESHSASFAKLAYLSAWLKCHEPEAFLAALLNSQPMGFYSPSQLVQDAKRHGVEVLPVDIMHSDLDATLEPMEPHTAQPPGTQARPAVRLGFNLVKGLSDDAALRIQGERLAHPYADIHDLATRANLNRGDIDALAAAGALRFLSGHRRQARWQAAVPIQKGLLRNAPLRDNDPVQLPRPSEGEEIVADYRSMGLSLGRHPLSLLRRELSARRFETAETLRQDYPDRRLARACGIVTGRQRPGTAKGTIFVTLEDETGNVNVIVQADLAQRQRAELVQAQLMGVYGVWQSHQGVTHLRASRLVDLTPLLGRLRTRSRDFH